MNPEEQVQASVIHKPGCAGFENARAEVSNICKSWCWGHMKCEPLPSDNSHYMVCGECFHVFMTTNELLDLHNQASRDAHLNMLIEGPNLADVGVWEPTKNVDDVSFCPVCIHDF